MGLFMCPPDDHEPVVELPPDGGHQEVTLRALRQRIRQQEILAELGVTALQGASLDTLLIDTARLTAEGLRTQFCKILEFMPAENKFLVRAGVGWDEGVVGEARVGADLESPAGFALQTGKPVISNHLGQEMRFRTPELLQRHNIRRAMNVILQGDGKPYGVLEVDSCSEDEFEERDLAFVQGCANILGMAIERERHERNLTAAIERHQFLLKEMNHRVKNSLTIVGSMLHLQASQVGDAALTLHLKNASNRVTAVARAHDLLYQGSDIEWLDLGKYIKSVCTDLNASVPACELHANVDFGIEIATDRAISSALIVNELVTNAYKHAYGGKNGEIWITISRVGDTGFSISVRDKGPGVSADFDPRKAKGLGMKLINAFVQQMNGKLEIRNANPGSDFLVIVPQSPRPLPLQNPADELFKP
jgi:two-component sensor histidine kinase